MEAMARPLIIWLVLVTWSCGCLCLDQWEHSDHTGFKVYRTTPLTKIHHDALQKLQSDHVELDFWTEPRVLGLPVDVMVPPKYQSFFEEYTNFNNLIAEMFIENVQDLIRPEHVSAYMDNMTWTNYHTLEAINAWLDHLVETHPNVVTNLTIGRSYEGREIRGVKISFKPNQRAVFIEGCMHAREWISPATVTYITNEILHGNDLDFARIARSFDWYIFPVLNPDGYAYTHASPENRLWRKTRSQQTASCYGVDLNRNFDFQWETPGTSTDPCSRTYGGRVPFSEVESKQLANFLTTIENKMDVYLAMHSYGQMMLYPYGYTDVLMDNAEDLQNIGDKAKQAIGVKYGTRYQVGTFGGVLYKANGTSLDWVRRSFGTPIAYHYEMRDTGKYGFVLPPDQIIPNCEEVMDSLVTIFNEAAGLGYFPLEENINYFM